jgi:glycosyltransferase involved in cell wall biosynthesis
MRVAFYAPLKPPDSPVPSGDRLIARLLIEALRRGGHEVTLLSRFRAFDAGVDPARGRRIQNIGKALAARYIRRFLAMPPGRRPQAVFTYHVYDKAPDWIGPALAGALGVPYVICEASLNPARARGANAAGHDAARAAIGAADIIIELNPADREGIAGALKPGGHILKLPPFIDTAAINPEPEPDPPGPPERTQGGTAALKRALARKHGLDANEPWLLAVAMMREGDKLESYRVLAEALALLRERPWRLLVAGDGLARAQVEDAFRSSGRDRVRFLGRQDGEALSQLYRGADIFVWPAVNEALGMAILEAQAAGMPVIAGRHGAIGEIVCDGVTGLVVPERDPERFAAAVAALLDDPRRAAAMGRAARENVRCRHGIEGAARVLDDALAGAVNRTGPQGHRDPIEINGGRRSGGAKPGASLSKQDI